MDGGVFVLTYKFCNNLYRLVLAQQVDTSSTLDKKQITLLETATKQTLLGMMMALSIDISMVAIALNVFIQVDLAGSVHNRLIIIWALSLLFIGFTTAIYMGFKVNEEQYTCLCRTCHHRLERLCERMAKRSAQNDVELQVSRVNSASATSCATPGNRVL